MYIIPFGSGSVLYDIFDKIIEIKVRLFPKLFPQNSIQFNEHKPFSQSLVQLSMEIAMKICCTHHLIALSWGYTKNNHQSIYRGHTRNKAVKYRCQFLRHPSRSIDGVFYSLFATFWAFPSFFVENCSLYFTVYNLGQDYIIYFFHRSLNGQPLSQPISNGSADIKLA